MTEAEINEAVARKLGWRFDKDATTEAHWHAPKIPSEVGRKCHDNIPPYATDIAVAWEIVEHWKELFELQRSKDGWCARFTELWDEPFDDPPSAVSFTGEADTAPLAICLAFLNLAES